jgi:hypothetical protein
MLGTGVSERGLQNFGFSGPGYVDESLKSRFDYAIYCGLKVRADSVALIIERRNSVRKIAQNFHGRGGGISSSCIFGSLLRMSCKC